MECPHCGDELEYDTYFGRLMGFQDKKVLGDIYRCPRGRDNSLPEEEACHSSCFHVAGSFYTFRDSPDDLHEGYPC